MKYFIFSLFTISLLGCDLLDAPKAVNEVPPKLDKALVEVEETNSRLAETQEAIRKQKLGIATENLFKEENTQILTPPSGMLPYGVLFAETATAEETLKYTFNWLKQVKKYLPNDLFKDDGSIDENVAVVVRHDKDVKLRALQIIAAFTPEDVVDQIIEEQIIESGEYMLEAQEFLALRAYFLKTFLMDESSFSRPFISLGQIEKAIEYTNKLSYLSQLPFASDAVLEISHPDLNWEANYSIDGLSTNKEKMLNRYWKKIRRGYGKLELSDEQKSQLAERIQKVEAEINR